MSTQSVQYGTIKIQYELTFAPRKTLGISVQPDLQVTVKAPEGTPLEEVEARVLKRAPWILKQQKDFERYLPHLPPRQYVSGETHRYLGRQYRLKVVESENGTEEGVKRDRSFITVHVQDKADTDRVRDLLDEWYHDHAGRVFQERLEACYPKMEHVGVPYPEIAIRAMRSRWGSCSARGRITLNVKLIKVPRSYIDYVIFHELCHLAEPYHSPRYLENRSFSSFEEPYGHEVYYEILDRILPDWRDRQDKLNSFEFG